MNRRYYQIDIPGKTLYHYSTILSNVPPSFHLHNFFKKKNGILIGQETNDPIDKPLLWLFYRNHRWTFRWYFFESSKNNGPNHSKNAISLIFWASLWVVSPPWDDWSAKMTSFLDQTADSFNYDVQFSWFLAIPF